jgi:hypothetical protein
LFAGDHAPIDHQQWLWFPGRVRARRGVSCTDGNDHETKREDRRYDANRPDSCSIRALEGRHRHRVAYDRRVTDDQLDEGLLTIWIRQPAELPDSDPSRRERLTRAGARP